jgi:hypothetical protein
VYQLCILAVSPTWPARREHRWSAVLCDDRACAAGRIIKSFAYANYFTGAAAGTSGGPNVNGHGG